MIEKNGERSLVCKLINRVGNIRVMVGLDIGILDFKSRVILVEDSV